MERLSVNSASQFELKNGMSYKVWLGYNIYDSSYDLASDNLGNNSSTLAPFSSADTGDS